MQRIAARVWRGLARLALLSILALAISLAGAARAVIIATALGTENTTAPANDPGWANVGIRGGLTAVYVGNGWVVTASHVGAGPVTFGGVTYQASPGPGIGFHTAPSGQTADLIVFKLKTNPPLPSLKISEMTPPIPTPGNPGAQVVMIGNGLNRGPELDNWGPDSLGQFHSGWYWGTGGGTRWGTNNVAGTMLVSVGMNTVTHSFWTVFDANPSTYGTNEAQAAPGDSGGAVFYQNPTNGNAWELAGILFAIAGYSGQPGAALDGNETYAVDLAAYNAQSDPNSIQNIVNRPACSDGIDDDGDGFVDFPADPGCQSATSMTESPACQDGIDNDGDGGIDYDGGVSANHGVALGPPDPQCTTPYRNTERASACGLGAEAAALVPLLSWLRRRRRLGMGPT